MAVQAAQNHGGGLVVSGGAETFVGEPLAVGDDELSAPLWLLVLLVVLLVVLLALPPPRLQPMTKRQSSNKATLRLMDDFLLFRISSLFARYGLTKTKPPLSA